MCDCYRHTHENFHTNKQVIHESLVIVSEMSAHQLTVPYPYSANANQLYVYICGYSHMQMLLAVLSGKHSSLSGL